MEKKQKKPRKSIKIRTEKKPPLTINTLPKGMRDVIEELTERCHGQAFTIVIPDVPKSLNHQYKQGKNKYTGKSVRFLDPAITTFRSVVSYSIKAKEFKPSGIVGAVILFENTDWITLKNEIRVADLDNRIKAVLDAMVNSKIEFEDERVWEIHAYKIKSRYKRTWVWLYDLGDVVETYA